MGVEPTLDLRPNLISNQAPSTTRPSLRNYFPCPVLATQGGTFNTATETRRPPLPTFVFLVFWRRRVARIPSRSTVRGAKARRTVISYGHDSSG